MTTAAEAFASAKINLTLHVTGRRSDGYHLLDSLVVFADVGDRLILTAGANLSVAVTGPFAEGVPTDGRNLVWRAAEAAGWMGWIELEKNLPHGAGIGGGSADAAAVLRALHGQNPMGGIGAERALERALELGADVPVCLSSLPQRMRGIGEQLRPVQDVPGLNLVLVNPHVHVPTPAVFRELMHRENPAMQHCEGWDSGPAFLDWLGQQRNDLEIPARSLAPEIGEALSALDGAILSRMSGSGATCFGVYDTMDVARNAARRIAAKYPEWWVQATRTVGSDARQVSRATT